MSTPTYVVSGGSASCRHGARCNELHRSPRGRRHHPDGRLRLGADRVAARSTRRPADRPPRFASVTPGAALPPPAPVRRCSRRAQYRRRVGGLQPAGLVPRVRVVGDVGDRVGYQGSGRPGREDLFRWLHHIHLGNGDYAPTGAWRVVTMVASASGLMIVTLSITYLVPLLSAVVEKRALAGRISILGSTVPEMVRKLTSPGADEVRAELSSLPRAPVAQGASPRLPRPALLPEASGTRRSP